MNQINYVYFGGEPLGVPVLEELKKADLLPQRIVCSPDRPVGRKQVITPPPVKVWAQAHDIPVWQPEDFKDQTQVKTHLGDCDLFVVVAYNKILPKYLIEMPVHGTLNVHPSLLPLLRGASPIRSAILQDMRSTGVSIMQMDEKMDHGPIVAQEEYEVPSADWPIAGTALDAVLAQKGGSLLAQTIPQWVAKEIVPQEQDHDSATYCGKFTKEMSELMLDPHTLPTGEEAYALYLKICAFDGIGGTYFIHSGKRIKVTDATLGTDNTLHIHQVVPEGKKEIAFEAFLKTL